MKKIIALILAAVLALSLCACGTACSTGSYNYGNSYVWSGNVPNDIRQEIPYLE